VVAAVAGDEGDAAAADLAEHERVARRAVRRLDDDLARVVEEGVEPGAADDADVRLLLCHVPSVGRPTAETRAAGRRRGVVHRTVRRWWQPSCSRACSRSWPGRCLPVESPLAAGAAVLGVLSPEDEPADSFLALERLSFL
jgi:hypothetical protein